MGLFDGCQTSEDCTGNARIIRDLEISANTSYYFNGEFQFTLSIVKNGYKTYSFIGNLANLPQTSIELEKN